MIPVGIPNPLFHNPLNSGANNKTSPLATVPGKGAASGFSSGLILPHFLHA
jgi:hypothetical protein